MKKHVSKIFVLMALLATLTLAFACGGGGGGSDTVAYNGNTDPAIADSTTSTPLAQSALNGVGSVFPTVQILFAGDPGGEFASLAVEPLVAFFYTFVTIPIPSEAVIDGADFGGEGTVTLAGTLTLELHSLSGIADTWTVIGSEMAGRFIFDGYTNGEGGQTVTGTMFVGHGNFDFSNSPVDFSMAAQDFLDDPGFPVFDYIEYTFNSLIVTDGEDSCQVGDGEFIIDMGEGLILEIYKVTVAGDGETLKIEDTTVEIVFGDGDIITISGLGEDTYGTFYDHTLGWIYFNADFIEEDPPGDVTSGYMELSTDGVGPDSYFYIQYNVDDGSYYNLYVSDSLVEKGWWVNWELTPDPAAPTIIN